MIPAWLHALSVAWLLLGAFCAVVITADEARHPQRMWIMNVVWPVCALFGTGWILCQYFMYGRTRHDDADAPFPVMVANGTLHCGSGCTLGDICAEWLIFAVPAVALAFGWRSIFGGQMIFAAWILDYLLAFAFGIIFQYFTIAPMRELSLVPGLIAAVKADTLSLTAWQVGMYGFMAIAYFAIFEAGLGVRLQTDMVEFWFMMQIAMHTGFLTAYPVNWLLLRKGLKEPM